MDPIRYTTCTLDDFDSENSDNCAICLDSLSSDVAVRMRCCGQVLHKACIETNVHEYKDNTCPLCRAVITEVVSGRKYTEDVSGDAGAALALQRETVRGVVGQAALDRLAMGDAPLAQRVDQFLARFQVVTQRLPAATRQLLLGVLLGEVRGRVREGGHNLDAEVRRRMYPQNVAELPAENGGSSCCCKAALVVVGVVATVFLSVVIRG